MPPLTLDATPGSKLEDEIHELRAIWLDRSHADTLAELEKTVRGLRAAEAQAVAERRRAQEQTKELGRLKDVERVYRAQSSQKHYAAEVGDVNTTLRRLVLGNPDAASAETVTSRLHEELRAKTEENDSLQEEVAQLRRLQREILAASGDGQAGELLSARHQIANLTSHHRQLVGRNTSLQSDLLRLQDQHLADRAQTPPGTPGAGVSSALRQTSVLPPAALCLHCKPKAVAWQTETLRSCEALQAQLLAATRRADDLTQRLYAGDARAPVPAAPSPVSTLVTPVMTPHSHAPQSTGFAYTTPHKGRVLSPQHRSNPPRASVPESRLSGTVFR